MLKIRLLVFVFFVSQVLFSQFRERFDENTFAYLQQSDSIYKAKKVKSRSVYFKGYGENKLKNKTIFNRDGKVQTISYPTEMLYAFTSEFEYDSLGKLIRAKDIYVKSNDSKYYKNFIAGDKEAEASYNQKPKQKVFDYQLVYVGNDISKVVRKDEKGIVITESTYKNNVLNQVYSDKEKYPLNFVCNYIQKNKYQFLVSSYEFVKSSLQHVKKFEYVWDAKNLYIKNIIQVHDSYYNQEKLEPDVKTYELEYDSHGLLVKMINRGYEYEYFYEYY